MECKGEEERKEYRIDSMGSLALALDNRILGLCAGSETSGRYFVSFASWEWRDA